MRVTIRIPRIERKSKYPPKGEWESSCYAKVLQPQSTRKEEKQQDEKTKTSGSNSWTYSYDYENRLKQATLNGVTALQAFYDGDGRRIETIAGDTTVYHYLAGSWDPAYVNDLTAGTVTDVVFAGGLGLGRFKDPQSATITSTGWEAYASSRSNQPP